MLVWKNTSALIYNVAYLRSGTEKEQKKILRFQDQAMWITAKLEHFCSPKNQLNKSM